MSTFIIILAIVTAFFIGVIVGGFVMFVFNRIFTNSTFFSDDFDKEYKSKVQEMRSRRI